MIRVLQGDCRQVLKTLPDESVHCVVTSPPYWNLRDYGVSGQIGLETTFVEYIEEMRKVFAAVHRVLRADGTLWLNLGDVYAATGGGKEPGLYEDKRTAGATWQAKRTKLPEGLKAKDLVGIPWRLAFALQADGWYLRSDIIWSKPNPMPESVTDRPTKAHEYLFLLSKSERYYYDAEAIMETTGNEMSWEQYRENAKKWGSPDTNENGVLTSHSGKRKTDGGMSHPLGRNRRTVWEIPTAPFSEAHFATFPPALVEPCILAGCPQVGTVLDPFGGAGTTGLVADRLGRNAILIELNPKYAEMAQRRLSNDAGMFASVAAE